jgi:TM2 domain-containing membrane protein YozV
MEQQGNNYQPVSPQPKDPNTSFLIEMVGGFFGLLGLGYFYVGRTNDGIVRLIAWLAYNITAYFVITLLLAVLIGIICLPIQLIIQIGVSYWSANTLKNDMLSGKTQ